MKLPHYYTLIFSFFLSIFLFSCKAGLTKETNQEEKRPNVLVIIADDLGAHDLSTTNSKYYETPNIDRIASEGFQFDQGYASCQVCSPSRASIMSGKFTANHGVTDWIGAASGERWRKANQFTKLLPPEYEHKLDTSFVTMPEAFRDQGYETFFAGKWHVGGEGSSPEDHGFNTNIGGYDVGSPHGGYFSPYNNPKLKDGPQGENLSMRLADETIQFMKGNKEKPFFACLSFYAVHSPIQTTEEKWKKYKDKAVEAGVAKEGYKMGEVLPMRQQQDNPVYAGLLESMDEAIGNVLSSLDELGLADNTIIVFTGDNGGVVSGDSWSTSNLPLRGGKGYQYEGGLRVPFLMKVPWMNQKGKKNDTPVISTDFYPTLLDLAGLDLLPKEHSDGVSLVPLMEGKEIEERPLIWHYPHYGNQGGKPVSVIRKGNWKLIHFYEDAHDELYDLSKDEGEQTNVFAANKVIGETLYKELFDYLKEHNAKYPTVDPEYSEEAAQKYLKRVGVDRKVILEEKRLEMLSDDFDPNNNWWGSQRIID
ncbi:sulfatase [Flammeovirga sp. MY04]|uniref:sulfatase n=1 Tax=Flammeovirga sp. MY04 TaxID=1191459 RepID=UPI0008063C6C|nr:sulfatase [Flammeovirga sp. MY04]ANQ51664.1 sulfatase [Flammeovirga sp. MY04]